MKKYTAIIPKRPAEIDVADYDAAIRSGHCVKFLRGECGDVPCSATDDSEFYRVDLDHIVPRCKEGGNGWENLQLLCSNVNQWEKRMSPDSHYHQSCWWDEPINLNALRPVQVEKAWNEIFRLEAEGEWISNPPPELLKVFMLMMWIVGSGKTIGLVVAIKAINHIINAQGGGRRRPTRVLVLTPQRSLAEQLKNEYQNELTKFGICQTAPKVAIIEDAGDWALAEMRQADIVCACNKAIWDQDNGRKLTEEQLSGYLSPFEVVALDECHYAIEQHQFLARLTRRALKFSLTATPIDREGNPLKSTENGWELFKLLSVYGYQEGYKARSLRLLLPWEEGIEQGKYLPIEGGASEELIDGILKDGEVNTKNNNNLTRDVAVVKKACERSLFKGVENQYDGHVMLVCGNIAQAKAWEDRINQPINGHGELMLSLPGTGWKAIATYSNSKGIKLSDNRHPWMLARNHKGKVQKDSCRVICVVDIGQYGINNKCCNVIGWVVENKSLIELIQRIGRALRRWHEGDQTEAHLVWPGKYPGMTEKIKEAVDYILNMEEYAAKYGFESVADFLESGAKKADPGPIRLVPGLTQRDRTALEKQMGRLIIDTGCAPDKIIDGDIERAVSDWIEQAVPPDRNKQQPGIDCARNLLRDPSYRARTLGLRKEPVSEPITIKENAPEIYDDAVLRQAIEDGKICEPKIKDVFLRCLNTEDGRLLISSIYAKHEQTYFVAPDVEPGTFLSELRKIASDAQIATFGHNGKPHPDLFKAVNRCAAQYFCLDNVRQETIASYESRLCDAITRGLARSILVGMTRLRFLKWHRNEHPEMAALYEDLIQKYYPNEEDSAS